MAFTLSVDSLADCTRDSERKQFEQALQEKNTELEHAYLAEDRLLGMDPHLMEAPKTHLWERDRLPNIK